MWKIVRWGLGALIALVSVGLVGMLVGVLWPLEKPAANVRHDRLLITNTALVDVESGRLRPQQDILIEHGRITAVGPQLEVSGAHVHDASGRFAIPGLFDMHVHSIKLSPVLTHPLFVAAGVTSVRDMGGCIGIEDAWVACADEKLIWDEAVRDAVLIGPRFDQITSLAINGGPEIPAGVDAVLGAATAEGARARAARAAGRGLDFLKVYTRLPREGYFALAKAAPEHGLYLAGHLPLAVSALEAIAAGQRSFEHAFLFIWECYPGMAALRGTDDPRAAYTNEIRTRMIADHDAALCDTLQRRMTEAGTAYVPTHTTRKLDAYAIDPTFRQDARLRYIPAPLRMLWLQDANSMASRAGDGGQQSYRAFYEFGIEQTGVAHRAGVTVLAGTDAPDSFAFPGTGLHDELEHLVLAGLSPLDALRAATLAPAAFLGLQGQAGVIAAGARGDIVLLDGNPLERIRAVRQIDSVVLAGVVYDRQDLDAMLAAVERNAGSWSMWPKFVWQLLCSPIMLRQFAD